MKQLVCLLAFLLAIGTSQAQKKEVIYLKNGTILKGQQIPVDDEKVVVRSGKDTWVFQTSEIDSVSSKFSSAILSGQKSYFIKTTGGLLIGSSSNDKSKPFSFDASFNLKVLPNWYAGVGTGVDFLEESYLPVFANLEYHFRESMFTPFVGVQAGYLFPLDDNIMVGSNYYYDIMPWSSSYYAAQTLDCQGGFMLSPSFGMVNQLNENLALMMSFGYRFHQVSFEGGKDEYKLEREYNRLTIRIGILFN